MSLRMLRIVFAAGLSLAMALLITNPGTSAASSALKGPKDRKAAPEFTLKDSQGVVVKLSDYTGKVVLLNFWATWCGPCKVEIPWFIEFESKFKSSGFAVLGVSMDDDGWKSVRPYLGRMHMSYRVMIGDDALVARYGGIESLPETLLIDREGRVAAKHIGLTSKGNYEQEIAELLRK